MTRRPPSGRRPPAAARGRAAGVDALARARAPLLAALAAARRPLLAGLGAALPTGLLAQAPSAPVEPAGQAADARPQAGKTEFASKRLPAAEGFRVFIVPDMEGMGSAVDVHEVIAGTEGERYASLTSSDYWDRFRSLLTKEVNATIAGARKAGARSFVVNEGHGGNLFANVLPWELDEDAILVRGWPKPIVMITGLDESFGTVIFTGAHANAGSPEIGRAHV